MNVTSTLLTAAAKQVEAAFQAVIAIRYGIYHNDTDLAQIAWELDDIKQRLEAKFGSIKDSNRPEQLELGE